MSKSKILHQHFKDNTKAKGQEYLVNGKNFSENEETDIDWEYKTFQEDPNIFLLNNLLMSVQFFENYDRDIKELRKNWFKELSIEPHHKKCFYADFLFKLVGGNVKFSMRHEADKNPEALLHPLRIYISSDNMEAAYDPSALGRYKPNVWPQYRFTVMTNEDGEKSGCINLVEFETLESPNKSSRAKKSRNNITFNEAVNAKETNEQNSVFWPRKSYFEEKSIKRLTKTEKLIASQNKEFDFKMLEKRGSLKYFNALTKNNISVNGLYEFTSPKAIIKPKSIQDFRMNFSPAISHKIPHPCFKDEVKKKLNSRRNGLSACFKTYKLLHAAAFKGYFCDLLIERLFEPLGFDFNSVNQSSVLKEFIIVNYKGMQNYITPVIPIRDWKNFVESNKRGRGIRKTELAWPSDPMQKIIDILPCYAVPSGNPKVTNENLDYEKTWKLVFPKAQEFLILHMMHEHVRCYIFVLLIYKSFIETEINCASFGPEHLMHLLFWRVHRNFLAWPEDRPGEILLNYLKILYKKLQSKTLYDFFITSRNLFASSLSKDLHKAQVLINKIIENPVPYIISAIKNLNFESGFYPALDILKLNTVLTAVNEPQKFKKIKKYEKRITTHFHEDEELQWKKNAIRKVELENRKTEERQLIRKSSVASINVAEMFNFNSRDSVKCNQILKIFASHFIKMASKSVEYNFLPQAELYLHQTQKLFEFIVANGINDDSLIKTKEEINKLKETCSNKMKKQNFNQTKEKVFRLASKEPEKDAEKEKEKHQKAITKEKFPSDEENIIENQVISVKL